MESSRVLLSNLRRANRFRADADVVLYRGDCLDLLLSVPQASIQLVITSPPYNLGKKREKVRSLGDYMRWQARVIDACIRVLQPGGSICWQVGNFVYGRSQIIPLDVLFFSLFARRGLKLRNRIIWSYRHGLHEKRRFSGRYETVLWFTRGDDYVFDLDAVRVPQLYPGKKAHQGPRKGEYSCNPLGANPSDYWSLDTWNIPNVKAGHVEYTGHGRQFPLELAERLVLALSHEGDRVLDPFCGVSTVLIAALKHGRRAVGSETDAEYCKLSRQRIGELEKGRLPARPWGPPMDPPQGRCDTKRPEGRKSLRSPIWWYGGKGILASRIIQLFPPHWVYIEPFCGGCSVFFRKNPVELEVLNDIDHDLIGFYQVLRDPCMYRSFRRKVELTPYSRAEYHHCRETWAACVDPVERAYRWFVVARMSFSGVFGRSWGYSRTSSRRGRAKSAAAWESAKAILSKVHRRLAAVQLESRDWREVLETYDQPGALFYCMPAHQRILGSAFSSLRIADVHSGERLPRGERVSAVYRRSCVDEEIYQIFYVGGGNGFPVECSGDHRLLAYRNKEYLWCEARNLRVGDSLVIQTNDYKNLRIKPKFENKKIKYGRRKESQYVEDLRSLCKLVGYYAAEGHFKKTGSVEDALVFSFGLHETDYHNEVVYLMRALFGVQAGIREGVPHSTVTSVYGCGRDLAAFFKKLVTGTARTKKLSPYVMYLPPEVQIEVLRSWLKGDGGITHVDGVHPEQRRFVRTNDRNKWKYIGTTASLKLAIQMYNIALRCRLHPSVKKRQNNYDVYFTVLEDISVLLQRPISGRRCSRRRWSDRGLITPITKIRTAAYSGEMIDLSCPKHHSYLTELGVVTHNCDPPYVIGTRKSDRDYRFNLTDDDHEDLVRRVQQLRGHVVVSGYAHDIYQPLEGAGWQRLDIATSCFAAGRTRGTGIVGEGAAKEKQKRVESLWLSPSIERR